MSSLSNIVDVCAALLVPLEEVNLYAGHKQVLFDLPDKIIESLRDESGDLTDKYDEFCCKYGVYYSDGLWAA